MADVSDVIIKQPYSQDPIPGAPGRGQVVVRNLRDTKDDAEFTARLTIELQGFREKYAILVGERNLGSLVKNMEATHLGRPETFYSRKFVAECDGRRAGLLLLKFHGDHQVLTRDHICDLCCCPILRTMCYFCLLDESPPRNTCYIDLICVDDGFRGKGVGKVLMDLADSEARKENCSSIYLVVTSTNRAISLYQRQGYSITNTRSRCGCFQCLVGVPAYHTMVKQL